MKKDETAETTEPSTKEAPSLLDLITAAARRPAAEVATVVADEHPVLAGRVRCAFGPRAEDEAWLPCLTGIRPRTGDRVLVLRPEGSAEGIVTGVVDGYRKRVDPGPFAAHVRRIRQDEVVQIESDTGEPLIQVCAGESGTTVRLLTKNIAVDAGAELRLEADAVAIVARQGSLELKASDDVVVNGEQIHLN